MVSDIKSPGTAVSSTVGGIGAGSGSIDKTNLSKGVSEFGDILASKAPGKVPEKVVDANSLNKPVGGEPLKFSQHAIERMASRGISFKPEELLRLNDAVEKAAQKGSRESLVLMGDNALIVSVKNKTVVTALDREGMKENVFTNIDSTVIL